MIAKIKQPVWHRRRSRYLGNTAAVAALSLGLVVVLLPFVWIFSTAFKTQRDAMAMPPLITFQPTFDNLRFLTEGFLKYEINSIIITTGATVLALVLGVPAGYALASSGGRRTTRLLGLWMLATYIVPGIVFIVPLFLIFNQLGLVNTHLGIILGYQTGLIPFTVWMSRSYFLDVPAELEDAARVDGCSRMQAFRKVVLPVTITGISTVGLLVAIFAWGEYFGTLILGGSDTYTVTIGIYNYVGSFGSELGKLAMASLIVVLPILFATVIAQRGLLRGITGGAVKG
jgi:ABC-type glycerol-3-phosphate transport system permease component